MDNQQAVASLAALAHESRLQVYRLLVEAGPTGLAAGEIGAATQIPAATLSFHLKELFRAGLVESRQDGRFIYYSANYAGMNSLLAYLSENCCARDGCGPGNCKPKSRAGSTGEGVKTRRAGRDISKT